MIIWQIIGYIGLGSIIGTIIISYVNFKMQKKRLLSEARLKAYSGVFGNILNCFIEDFVVLKWPFNELKMNSILGDSILLSGKNLFPLLLKFKKDILDILNYVEKNGVNDEAKKKQIDLFKSNITDEIREKMREDLNI